VKRAVFGLIALLVVAAPVRAQVAYSVSAPYRSVMFGNHASAAQTSGPHGFTALVNIGAGFQHDFDFGGGAGVGGLNFGIGGFVTHKLAILARFSGTTVDFSDLVFPQITITQSSGVFGATAQYWTTPRFALEAGGGYGSWNDSNGAASDASWGLILGASVIVFEHGSHHLVVGGEYAPVITSAGTVHNIGVTAGYQFFRR
jgi:hypothetical protein